MLKQHLDLDIVTNITFQWSQTARDGKLIYFKNKTQVWVELLVKSIKMVDKRGCVGILFMYCIVFIAYKITSTRGLECN